MYVPEDPPETCPACGDPYASVSRHDGGFVVNLLDNERYRRVCFYPVNADANANADADIDADAAFDCFHHTHRQTGSSAGSSGRENRRRSCERRPGLEVVAFGDRGVRADQRAGQVHSLQRGALVDHGVADLRVSDRYVREDDGAFERRVGDGGARHDVDHVAEIGVLDDRVVGNERSTVERVLHRVEVAVGGADVEPRAVEGVRVDRAALLEPLEEPPRLVGVVAVFKVRREVGQRLRGERVTRDGDERRLRVVGLLLEVDDLVAVEIDEPVGLGALAVPTS